MASKLQTPGCLLAVLLLGACAASPPERAKHGSVSGAAPADIRLDIGGALPIFGEVGESGALVASRFSASVDEDRLRYRAIWRVEPGEALAQRSDAAQGAAMRLGGQRLGQDVDLRLPALAGSPLSLGLSSEFRTDLSAAGYQEQQHEQARLDWSPGAATLQVQWAGNATPFDPGTGLVCDLRSSLRLPTAGDANRSHGLTLFGRICTVAANGTPYAGIEAETWGLGYAWDRSDGRTEALLSVIDPTATTIDAWHSASRGYELDLGHRRAFGGLSAEMHVFLREAPSWAAASSMEYAGGDTGWSARTSLTFKLEYADLSASWANGVDLLWFTPENHGRSDRFGLSVNLSRWLDALAPEVSPRLAVNWNWSRLRLPNHTLAGDNALRLDVALNL